jgi:hypothetical protein
MVKKTEKYIYSDFRVGIIGGESNLNNKEEKLTFEFVLSKLNSTDKFK